MNYDDLDRKIIAIRKRGLNKILEDTLTADVRRDFYAQAIEERLENISIVFRRNVNFLERMHKSHCSAGKIRETMGLKLDKTFNEVLFDEKVLYTLRYAVIVSEFYGITTELLLFTDLEANEKTIKEQYPAIFKQSRH